MMDRLILGAVEAAFHFGFPLDAGAVLIIEVDGLEAGLDAQMATRRGGVPRAGRARAPAGARRRRARGALEGPQAAFGAVGRLAPELLHAGRRRAAHQAAGHPARHRRGRRAPPASASPTSSTPATATSTRSCCSTSATPTRWSACSRPATRSWRSASRWAAASPASTASAWRRSAQMPLLFSPDDLLAMTRLRAVFDPEQRANPHKIFPDAKVCVETRTPAATGGAVRRDAWLVMRGVGVTRRPHGRSRGGGVSRCRAGQLLPDRESRPGRARLCVARRRGGASHRRWRRPAAALLARRPGRAGLARRTQRSGDRSGALGARAGSRAHRRLHARDGVRGRQCPSPRRDRVSGRHPARADPAGPRPRWARQPCRRRGADPRRGARARRTVATPGSASICPSCPRRAGSRGSSCCATWTSVDRLGGDRRRRFRRSGRAARSGRRHRAAGGGATWDRRRGAGGGARRRSARRDGPGRASRRRRRSLARSTSCCGSTASIACSTIRPAT